MILVREQFQRVFLEVNLTDNFLYSFSYSGTWWVFYLVIISAYTANLAAVLTVSRPYIPIKNLDDLANQTTISYGTIRGGSTMQFFQESRIAAHVKMWQYMKDKDVFVTSNGKGVERALSMNYAYLMESTSLEYETQQNCNLTQIGGVLGSKGYGIALAKSEFLCCVLSDFFIVLL